MKGNKCTFNLSSIYMAFEFHDTVTEKEKPGT
jgi:hypothetical protein